jgi:hypothetical protein
MGMSTRRIIPHAPKTAFANTVLASGEIVAANGQLYLGDGSTPGGKNASADTRMNVTGNLGQGFDFRLMTNEEDYDGVANGSGKVDALRIAHVFGGSNTRGGRHAIETFCIQQAPSAISNPDHNYVGGSFTGYALTHDNGTPEAPLGSMFGIGAVGRLGPGATNYNNLTAAEFNTEIVAGASVSYKSIIQLTGFATDTVRGTDIDCMISLSRQNGGTTFRDGILFNAGNGLAPMGTDSTLIRTEGTATALSGLDVSSYLFVRQAVRIGQTTPEKQAGIGIRQQANGSTGVFIQRNTDTDPTGNLVEIVNSINTAVVFSVDALGRIGGNSITVGNVIAQQGSYSSLPVYADNAAASALGSGSLYRTAAGQVMVKY